MTTTLIHATQQIRPLFLLMVGLATQCLIAPAVGTAQTPAAQQDDLTAIMPFTTQSTCLFLKVDVDRVQMPDLQRVEIPPQVAGATNRFLEYARDALAQLRSLANEQPVYLTAGLPTGEGQLPAFGFVRGAVKPLMEKKFPLAAYAAEPPAALPIAWQAVQQFPIQLAFVPPEFWRRTLRELPTELPEQIGGGSSTLLSEGVLWAALGVDPENVRAELVIQSGSEQAARDLAAHLPHAAKALTALLASQQKSVPPELADTLTGVIQPQVSGTRMTVTFDGLQKNTANLQLLAVLSQLVGDKSRRAANSDKFKRILLSMHNYYDVHQSFTPVDTARGPAGKPLLSWRVYVLPYLQQNELYKKFHLDEPWDSPHNKPLIDQMPDVFASDAVLGPPAQIKPGHTTFLAPAGEGTVFGQSKSARFQDITDGTSNTVVLVEVKPARAVPWTAPQDYGFDTEKPLAGVLVSEDGYWLAACGDGSVHALRSGLSTKTVLHLFQMADGQVVDSREIE